MRTGIAWIGSLAALVGVACGSPASDAPLPPAAVASSAAPPAAAPPAASSSAAAPGPAVDENRGRRRRFGDAAVFVDGAPRGVLRVLELPPRLPRRDAILVDGRKVARWRLAEYLRLQGVDLDRLREVHVLGGRGRTAVIPGAEVRRLEAELLFSFTRGATGGKPRIHWPKGIRTNTTIDVVGALCVYVEKPPPRYDKAKRALFAADGTKIEGIPYAAAEAVPKGTRVYVDGVYVGAVKKKLLADALLAADATTAEPRFSLARFLASVGADPAGARAIDLIDGDALAARIDPATWAAIRDRASFAVTSGSRGRAALRVPDPPPGLAGESLVSAVLVHRAPPPALPAERLAPADVPGSREPQVAGAMP